jgi:hypothetical protein
MQCRPLSIRISWDTSAAEYSSNSLEWDSLVHHAETANFAAQGNTIPILVLGTVM